MKSQLWAVGEEASCPFKHHSRTSLRQLLQPCSEFDLNEIFSLIDAGDYNGACCVYLSSLANKSCSVCSSLNTPSKPAGSETVGSEDRTDWQNDMEAEETSDSGYDSAQSCQPMQENNGRVVSRQISESANIDNRFCLSKTSTSSDSKNTAVCDCQCRSATALLSELNHRICNVEQDIVGCHRDVVHRKFQTPVDFYVSFNRLVTGLQCSTS